MDLNKTFLLTFSVICFIGIVTCSSGDGENTKPRLPLPPRMKGIAKYIWQPNVGTFNFLYDVDYQRAALFDIDGRNFTVWDYNDQVVYEGTPGNCKNRSIERSYYRPRQHLPLIDPETDPLRENTNEHQLRLANDIMKHYGDANNATYYRVYVQNTDYNNPKLQVKVSPSLPQFAIPIFGLLLSDEEISNRLLGGLVYSKVSTSYSVKDEELLFPECD